MMLVVSPPNFRSVMTALLLSRHATARAAVHPNMSN
jgi:hypothetical protein